jgi:hypothetical protein
MIPNFRHGIFQNRASGEFGQDRAFKDGPMNAGFHLAWAYSRPVE